jgi:hypothetical protein
MSSVCPPAFTANRSPLVSSPTPAASGNDAISPPGGWPSDPAPSKIRRLPPCPLLAAISWMADPSCRTASPLNFRSCPEASWASMMLRAVPAPKSIRTMSSSSCVVTNTVSDVGGVGAPEPAFEACGGENRARPRNKVSGTTRRVRLGM